MCGIFGVYNFSGKDGKKVDFHLFDKCLGLMSHRGPDNKLSISITEHLTLGHVRLAIIDLAQASNQPFSYKSKKFWIVFNGEIYNYLEIREDLKKIGVIFATQSDTEVLLQAYINYGATCVHLFNGMWAFSIFDVNKNKLFCSRDRFGVKPFNYSIV